MLYGDKNLMTSIVATAPIKIPFSYRCDSCNTRKNRVEITYYETMKKTRFCSYECFAVYQKSKDQLRCLEDFNEIMRPGSTVNK